MTPFEKAVSNVLQLQGYKVQHNILIDGHQIDLYGEYSTGVITLRLMIECKDYGNDRKVGVREIQEFHGALSSAMHNGLVDKGFIVSMSGFTADARRLAKEASIELTTYTELSTQMVNFDPYIDRIITSYESSPIAKYYIESNGTDTEDYGTGKNTSQLRPIDDLVNMHLFEEDHKKLALLGNFGTGKSTFCLHYTYILAKKFRVDKTSRIPIQISLRDYNARFDIQTLIVHTLMTTYGVNISLATSIALQRLGRFIFIFDGFDEMDTTLNTSAIHTNLRELKKISAIKENKFILTCRTHFFRNSLQAEVLEDYDVLYIPEWGETELAAYLQKKFGSDWQKFLLNISGTHNLSELATTPLFLEMIIETLSQSGDAITRADLFQMFTDSWISNQSRRKGALLSSEQRKGIILELAINLYFGKRTSYHYKEFRDLLYHYFSKSPTEGSHDFKIDDAVQLDYLCHDVQTCTFLKRDVQGNYSFAHKSLMEFFVAMAIFEGILKEEYNYLSIVILPIEIRDFLITLLKQDPPTALFIRWLEGRRPSILRDNLLALLSLLDTDKEKKAENPYSASFSEADLIMFFMQGDQTAFRQIFSLYYSGIYAYILQLVDTAQIAKGLAIEVFIQLWKMRHTMNCIQKIKAYLLALSRNKGIDYLRKQNQMNTLKSKHDKIANWVAWEAGNTDAAASAEIFVALLQAIDGLPPADQELYHLHFTLNKSTSEIAKILYLNHAVILHRRDELLRQIMHLLHS